MNLSKKNRKMGMNLSIASSIVTMLQERGLTVETPTGDIRTSVRQEYLSTGRGVVTCLVVSNGGYHLGAIKTF